MLRMTVFTLLYLMTLTAIAANSPPGDPVVISDAYARATLPGVKMSAIFMKLYNSGNTPLLLLQAHTDVARFTELHMNIQTDGIMRMRKIAHIHLDSGKIRELKPGGLHIMLMGLTQRLTAEQTISLQLTFDNGQRQTLQIPVRSF